MQDLLSQKLGGRNLYLVGMMGSGKSSSGPHLAKEILYKFVDTDQIIEKLTSKTILDFFRDEGESSFRELETKVLKEISCRHSLVVATGGGIVLRSQNWGLLHQGVVIWIDPDREQLFRRLQFDSNPRPLLQNLNWKEDIDSLIIERQSFYSQSDLHIKIKDESAEDVSFQIIDSLNSLLRNQGD